MVSRSPEGSDLAGLLGPVAHVAMVVDDVAAAASSLAACGLEWSAITHPVARLRDTDGRVEDIAVDYVTTRGGEPRLKLLSAVAGSFFVAGASAVHHVSYWVDDIEAVTAVLCERGWTVERSGVDLDGSLRYRYLRESEGPRLELGRRSDREEFDAWADDPGSAPIVS